VNDRPEERRTRAPGAPWKTLVRARIRRLHEEIDLSRRAGATGEIATVSLTAAKAELAEAEKAIEGGGGLLRAPLRWWTGSDQEQAWLAVHGAETHLVLARPEEALRAEVATLQSRIPWSVPPSDPLRRAWTDALERAADASQPLDRYLLREIKETLLGRADATYVRMRSFRNILVVAILVLALATGLLAIPSVSDWIPLCPDDGAAGADTDCVIDDVWQAELLGAVGGLLALLTSIQRLRGFRNPYNLPVFQALLKIPAGALTGLLGLVLMQSGILFLEPQLGNAAVAYVIFFGAAQDVITRLVDRKAGEIAGAAGEVIGSEPSPA